MINRFGRGVGKPTFNSVAAEVVVPALTDFGTKTQILTPTAAAWDARFASAAPASVIKRGSTYYMYYVGALGTDRADGGPADRGVGLATATDPMGTWTKHAPNPVVPYSAMQRNNDDEEGAWAVTAYVDGSEIILFVSELFGSGGTVNADIGLWTSTDGSTFTDQGIVIANTALDGNDEKKVMGVHKEADGTWNLYYNAKGSDVTDWAIYVASGNARNNFTSSTLVRTSSVTGSNAWRGGGDVAVYRDDGTVSYVMPVKYTASRFNDVLRFTDETAPTTETLARNYAEDIGMSCLLLDRSASKWYLFTGGGTDDDIAAIHCREATMVLA